MGELLRLCFLLAFNPNLFLLLKGVRLERQGRDLFVNIDVYGPRKERRPAPPPPPRLAAPTPLPPVFRTLPPAAVPAHSPRGLLPLAGSLASAGVAAMAFGTRGSAKPKGLIVKKPPPIPAPKPVVKKLMVEPGSVRTSAMRPQTPPPQVQLQPPPRLPPVNTVTKPRTPPASEAPRFTPRFTQLLMAVGASGAARGLLLPLFIMVRHTPLHHSTPPHRISPSPAHARRQARPRPAPP